MALRILTVMLDESLGLNALLGREARVRAVNIYGYSNIKNAFNLILFGGCSCFVGFYLVDCFGKTVCLFWHKCGILR